MNGTLYQRRIPLYFHPFAPENGGFSVFLSVIFVLLMYQTQAWRITVRFVFLCFCKRKMERRFAYTLLNQQMNHLLIIIYIIGTHTCFHKNTKIQKCKGVSAEHQAGLAVMPSDAAFRWWNIKMQNMSTKASLHDLCPLTKHLNFFYTPYRRIAWKKLRDGVAEKFSSPRKKIWHSSPNPLVPIKFYK